MSGPQRIEISNLGAPDGIVAVLTGASVSFERMATGDAIALVADVTGDVIGDLVGSATKVPTGTPVNAVSSSADIGAGTDGTVTTSVDVKGVAGDAYSIEVVAGTGNNSPLDAAIVGTAITVTLATDGVGDPDDAANTATLIAAAIDALSGVSAVASGTGADPISTAEGPTDFDNGVDGTVADAGAVLYDATYLYVAIAAQTIAGANWRRIALGSVF